MAHFAMKNLGYYNGTYDLIENMTVPMNDRACYFGDGVFEVAYVRNYRIYAVEEHMDRLYESADYLGIRLPMAKESFVTLLESLVRKVDDHEQLLYWQISRGTGLRNHAPTEPMTANIWVTIRPMKLRNSYEPMKLITVPDTRFFHCNMKTLNLIPTVMASIQAQERGADEAVFHRDGRVTECAHSNLAIIRDDGAVQTAPADNMILAGIARHHMLKACEALGIPAYEEPFSLDEMMAAAEVFVTSSGTLCRPASEIDGIPVGGRAPAVLNALRDALHKDFYEKTE